MPSRLEIEEDLQFQRRSWALQRVGWALMAVAIVCGLLGVFGAGLLSSASVENPESVRIEYERFIRYQVPTSLKIKLRTATGTDRAYLSIGRDYLDAMKIEKIVPEPAAEKAEDGSIVYVFDVGGPGELLVKFELTPRQIGALTGAAGPQPGTRLSFRQVVYP